MPATGGIKLTPATGGDDDFDEGYEKDGETPWSWKRVKLVSDGGSWHGSWQGSWQKSSWQKSSWTKWKRHYHYQPASGSSSSTWAGTSEVHSLCSDSESLLASGSMRQQLADALSDWAAFPSSLLLTKSGLEDFARRAAWQAKKLQEDPPKEFQEWALQTALPLEPRPASGGAGGRGGGGYMSIKDVVTLHRGEVRQLGGVWAICDPNTEEFAARHAQLRGIIVKPASGGAQVKVAKVFSVMDLFMALGKSYSATELYSAYLTCEIIARKRARSQRQ